MKNNDIFVFSEIQNNSISETTFELIAKAKELSTKSKGDVVALLLESKVTDLKDELIYHGADKVIVIQNDLFKTYDPMVYKDALVPIIKKYDPSILLLSASFLGRSLAPRLQGALQTGLTADVLDLDIDKDNLLHQIKPAYGDNLMCTIVIPNHRPQMTTIRPKVFKKLKKDENLKGEIITEDVNINKTHTFEVIDTQEIVQKEAKLEDAKIVVAIGRGLKSQDNLDKVKKLAALLNAKIGVTRPLAENGWYNVNRQIGQSGVSISPDLILNLGISGAVQYTSGMKDAKFSVSVNKDPEASIFKETNIGIHDDVMRFIDEMIKQLS